jgi:two-component system sensor histidine kinase VicK
MLPPSPQKISVALLWAIVFLVGCNAGSRKNLPQGSRAQTDSTFKLNRPYFENGMLRQGMAIMDSIFHGLKHPTLQDYAMYYNTHSWCNGAFGNPHAEINYADSLILLLQGRELNTDLTSVLLHSYTFKANAFFELKNYPKAIDVLFTAKETAKHYADECSNMELLYNLSMILYRQKEYRLALDYFRETAQYNKTCNKAHPYFYYKEQELMGNMGLCYNKLEQQDSALLHYQKALEILEQHPDSLAIEKQTSHVRFLSGKAVVYGNMAKVFVAGNQFDTAIALYRNALHFHQLSNIDIVDEQLCRLQLSQLYLRTNQLDSMISILKQVASVIHLVPRIDVRLEYQNLIYQYYKAIDQKAKAFDHYQLYIATKDSIANDDRQMFKTNIDKELKGKEQLYEIQLLQKNNQLSKLYLWVFVAVSIIALGIGILIYYWFVKSRKDVQQLTILNAAITQQKKEIEAVMQQLELSNIEKERLMNIMAHELRSPISGITSIAGTMLQSNDYSSEQEELLEMIENTSATTLNLINEILESKTVSNMPLNRQWTDLNLLVKQTINLLQFKANEKQVKIMAYYAPEAVMVFIDAEKMERAVSNLITNGIKFSNAKSSITVRVQLEANKVLLSVGDEGIGIPKELQEKLFGLSSDIKRSGTAGERSFGLGLSICKQIVQQHGGEIWVESEEHQGSTFYISLHLGNDGQPFL